MDNSIYEKTEYALGLIAAGDDRGLDLLYGCMGRTMLFIAKGIVKDARTAEEVVQDSFLKIVKHIKRYKRGTNAYAWVCRIVRNTALNALKRDRGAHEKNLDEFVNLSDGQDMEERSATRILVEKIMDSLAPPIVKKMVYMKYFMDMTVREIAKEVGKSKSYVSKELIKAEEQMRKTIGDAWTKR